MLKTFDNKEVVEHEARGELGSIGYILESC